MTFENNKFTAVFFDLDGTLAETESIKAQALAMTIQNFGGNSEPEKYKEVMGQSWENVTNKFMQHAGLNLTLENFDPAFKKIYLELIDTSQVFKKETLDFINYLKNKKMTVGLVTSAAPWIIEKILPKGNLEKSFDIVVSGADTKRHKPDPEAYELALQKLNIDPSAVLAFEDSEAGFQAAASAGITSKSFN